MGGEFYGNGFSTIKPFRSLEYLSFEYMLEWQEWVIFEGEIFSSSIALRIFLSQAKWWSAQSPSLLD